MSYRYERIVDSDDDTDTDTDDIESSFSSEDSSSDEESENMKSSDEDETGELKRYTYSRRIINGHIEYKVKLDGLVVQTIIWNR